MLEIFHMRSLKLEQNCYDFTTRYAWNPRWFSVILPQLTLCYFIVERFTKIIYKTKQLCDIMIHGWTFLTY
jgi:hypothetical protein